MVLISALTGIVDDLVAKKASNEVIKIPSSSSTINDCANDPLPLLVKTLYHFSCLTAITLLDVLVSVLVLVVDVLCVLASLVETMLLVLFLINLLRHNHPLLKLQLLLRLLNL